MSYRISTACWAVTAALALTACGSTVQQSTLASADPLPGGGAEAGLEVPGTSASGLAPVDSTAAGAAAGPAGAAGAPAADGPAQPGASGSQGGAAGAAAPQTQGTSPAGGVVDSTPLRLGLFYNRNDAAEGAGVNNGNTFGSREALEALVKAYNADGGIGGRKILPTYVEQRSSSSSYASDLQAACSTFVEDVKAQMVFSFLGFAEEQFSQCLARAGIVHVNGRSGLGDKVSVSQQPTTVSTNALNADRRSAAMLEGLVAAGHLSKSSRIGLVVEGCPYNDRAAKNTLRPTAARLGLQVVDEQRTRCFGGLGDLSGLAADAQNAVLRFSGSRVDRVMFLSSLEGVMLLTFANAAESQGYRPGYALTSLAVPNVIKDNVPASQLAGAKGTGWMPAFDVPGPWTTTPAARECVARMKQQGVTPTGAADHIYALGACETFALAQQVLTQTRGAAVPGTWFRALTGLGTTFQGSSALDGRTDFRDGRREAPALARTFAWDGACTCFRYTGKPSPIG